jgi:hypothetical protein
MQISPEDAACARFVDGQDVIVEKIGNFPMLRDRGRVVAD